MVSAVSRLRGSEAIYASPRCTSSCIMVDQVQEYSGSAAAPKHRRGGSPDRLGRLQ